MKLFRSKLLKPRKKRHLAPGKKLSELFFKNQLIRALELNQTLVTQVK